MSVLAVDIGGTTTVVGLVDSDGRVRERRSAATPAALGPQAVIATVVDLAASLDGYVAVGVGTAGAVDVATGTIVSSTDTFADWTGTPVRELLRVGLGSDVPIVVENDVDAHAAGEGWRGAAAGLPSALVVAVGTGVGAALLLDGRVHRGAHHLAGEIGHLPVPGAESMRCPCGRLGHLEALSSGVGLHRRYLDLGGDPSVVDARQVVIRTEDEIANQAINDSGAALGRALAGLVTTIDPAAVILTGGMAEAGDTWWHAMETTLRDQLVDALHDVPVLPGLLGADAPLIGAAAGVWRDE